MQELLGSVRRSLVFRSSTSTADDDGFGGFVDKIGSSIRKSRIGLFAAKSAVKTLPISPVMHQKDDAPPIRWRKGELIGCGAFGRVYMGMNLDSGELIAVKQVLIASGGASREKAQAHIRELEEEVKLLKNLSHPNIVRYLGTAREEEALNIFLEFVPGGSISSLLGKFGSFPESVIRMYTKQLLLGLEYLHKNGIMHRDIKGANILVDNKGCIKLADFGASKKVVELATMTGAKSMKGTPYWMAPEVILQTGHNISADIWSVGCTIIEMATGKPPWCQYQEVQALFHIGTTKSHPPIPEHLSSDAKDFLSKCLQKEPSFRKSASELLQHPFVAEDFQESQPVFRSSVMESSRNQRVTTTIDQSDDEMCRIDDDDDFAGGPSSQLNPTMPVDDFNKSFNPMCEPTDDWPCKFEVSPEVERSNIDFEPREDCGTAEASCTSGTTEFSFPSEALVDDDEEVTESKIRAFLDEKAFDLKKLQEEFYSTLNVASPKALGNVGADASSNLHSKSKSPAPIPSRRLSTLADVSRNVSPVRNLKPALDKDGPGEQLLKDISEIRETQKEGYSISPSFSERQRLWKEELVKELEMERERLRQAGGKTSSPNSRVPCQQKERLPFISPPK